MDLSEPYYQLFMQADNFEIAENSENLEYYAYIREVLQSKQIAFWVGNPSVQLLSGTVYPRPPLTAPNSAQTFQIYLKQYVQAQIEDMERESHQNRRTLVLIGIRNDRTPIQVCQKLKMYLDTIAQIRVFKTDHSRYYGMLMLFRTQAQAERCYRDCFGDEYSGFQVDRVLFRWVEAVGFAYSTASKDAEMFYGQRKKSAAEDEVEKMGAEAIFLSLLGEPGVSLSPPRPKSYGKEPQPLKQPTLCAICFENSSERTLISILCSHYFHVPCLSQWQEAICPLCRYHQHPPLVKFCEKCNQYEGLWVCLVCGVRLCCGENHNIVGAESHIYQHFMETQHRLSMDVDSKFVFDASQPAFLHQMLYREVMKSDTGLGSAEQGQNKAKKSKLSEKISEYEQSISEEMQKQRAFFEENIAREVKKRKEAIKERKVQVAQLEAEIAEINDQTREEQRSREQIEKATANLEKELKVIEEVQKYWKAISKKKEEELSKSNAQIQNQLALIQIQIAEKRQELKDFKTNRDISERIKSNLGKQEVSSSVILELGHKNGHNKKKKK